VDALVVSRPGNSSYPTNEGARGVKSSKTKFLGIDGSGIMKVPVTVIFYGDKRLTFSSTPTFEGFNLAVGDFALKDVNGRMKIREELALSTNGGLKFLYVKKQSPFTRVDYEGFQPFLVDRPGVSIDSVQWRHIKLGPLFQSIDVSQNLILLDDLRLDGLGGGVVGRFYIDLTPRNQTMGVLGRFTGIQPEMLKPPGARLPAGQTAELSGRTALTFDLQKRLVSGRIDLNSIGREQLSSLLDILDPDGAEQQVAVARQALRIAYPTRVALAMGRGLMDMEVAMGGAVSGDYRIRSLPLTSFVNSYGGDVLEDLSAVFGQ
jgi:hypothetical protein